MTYCLNQWAQLEGYLLGGRLEIDNNRSERAIKPFVIGRSNRLFSNTPRARRPVRSSTVSSKRRKKTG
ncbi:transposase [Sulfobacillus sp. DSM 109850]|uniref:Transposase n=1 Tax=Sulfobacillus harzensis TaxID=2729629 RepID=A0A7Y0L7Y0_9FIRM|nr:transposase [Sulfobacillus harzensis]